jgi:hypothetical protein
MELPPVIVVDRRTWWATQRKCYNITLTIAAPLSLVASLIVWGVFEKRLPCLEITAVHGFLALPLFMIGLVLANICYFFGPLSERIIRPRNVNNFRSWVYGAGAVFSVVIVFSPAILNLISALLGPFPCTDKFGVRHGFDLKLKPTPAERRRFIDALLQVNRLEG